MKCDNCGSTRMRCDCLDCGKMHAAPSSCTNDSTEEVGFCLAKMDRMKMRECVTHHHACDCREQMFAEMQAENMMLKKRLQYANGKLSESMLKLDELRDIISKPNDRLHGREGSEAE